MWREFDTYNKACAWAEKKARKGYKTDLRPSPTGTWEVTVKK